MSAEPILTRGTIEGLDVLIIDDLDLPDCDVEVEIELFVVDPDAPIIWTDEQITALEQFLSDLEGHPISLREHEEE